MGSVTDVRNETIPQFFRTFLPVELIEFTVNFRPGWPYWFSNAPESDTASARPHAALHERRRADARHRHRRQYRDLQRRPGCAVEAVALPAIGRARHDRSLGARDQPAERRRRAVSVLHLSRTR